MKRRTLKAEKYYFLLPLLFLGIGAFFASNFYLSGKAPGIDVSDLGRQGVLDAESFSTWHELAIKKTNSKTEYPNCIVSYGPEGIIYADRIVRNDNSSLPEGSIITPGGKDHSSNDAAEPLDVDLVLRILPALGDSGAAEERIFADIISINGDVSLKDLKDIRISSIEVFHGKVYAGIWASDGYDNKDGTFGTNDLYRRWLYVSESVNSGTGVSRMFKSENLGAAVLSIKGILPGIPHTEQNPEYGNPTSVKIQLRSSESMEGLDSAVFFGPDNTQDSFFELSSENCDYGVGFPESHKWVQYKVFLHTADSRLTPVLEQVSLSNDQGLVFSDTDWSYGGLIEFSGLYPYHSPGEIVLANKKLDNEKTLFVKVLQPSFDEPPQWLFEVGTASRRLSHDAVPYRSVADIEPFQEKLYFIVGDAIGVGQSAYTGDFVSYDFKTGLFKVEGHTYTGGDPSEKTLWGEGIGRLMKAGDLLLMSQPDAKTGSWDGTRFIPSEQEEHYIYTDGSGVWDFGFTPKYIRNKQPIHLWDLELFNNKYFASTNWGVITRRIPQNSEEHTDTSAWEYFGLSPPLSGSVQDSMSTAYFSVFDRHMLVSSSINYKEGDSPAVNIVNFSVLDKNNIFTAQIDTDMQRFWASKSSFEHDKRLVFWNQESKLYFTEQKFHIISADSSLEWESGTEVDYLLDTAAGIGELNWEIYDGRLPEGLELDSMEGRIYGSAIEEGAFDVLFRVEDSNIPKSEDFVWYSIAITAQQGEDESNSDDTEDEEDMGDSDDEEDGNGEDSNDESEDNNENGGGGSSSNGGGSPMPKPEFSLVLENTCTRLLSEFLVFDKKSEKPIHDAMIMFNPQDAQNNITNITLSTDASGVASIMIETPGVFNTIISKAGYKTKSQEIQFTDCGVCYSDLHCKDDEQCVGSLCSIVDCPCGKIERHACYPYECCSDNDCGEGACIDNKCALQKEILLQQPSPVTEKTTDLEKCGFLEIKIGSYQVCGYLWMPFFLVLIIIVIITRSLLSEKLAQHRQESKEESKKESFEDLIVKTRLFITNNDSQSAKAAYNQIVLKYRDFPPEIKMKFYPELRGLYEQIRIMR